MPSATADRRKTMGLVTQLVLSVLTPILVYFAVVQVHGLRHQFVREAKLVPLVERHPEAADFVAGYVESLHSIAWLLSALCVLVVGISGTIAVRWARHLAGQVNALQHAADRMAGGNLEAPIEVHGSGEIDSLVESLQRMRESLKRRIDLQARTSALARDRDLAETTRNLFLPRADRHTHAGVTVTGSRSAPDAGGRTLWQQAALADRSVVALTGQCVMGGTSAAMVASVVATCLRLHVLEGSCDVSMLLRDVHRTLRRAGTAQGQLRFDLVHVCLERGTVDLYSGGGEGAQLTAGENASALAGGGRALGGDLFDVSHRSFELGPDAVDLRLEIGDTSDGSRDHCEVQLRLDRHVVAA